MVAPSLKPVDRVEVLTLVDNVSDLLLASDHRVERLSGLQGTLASEPLRAEHGYSALICVFVDGVTHRFLLDTGLSEDALLHNMAVLEVDPASISAVILSHGHTDHTRGLDSFIKAHQPQALTVYMHPDALLERRVRTPDGKAFSLPAIDPAILQRKGCSVEFNKTPKSLFGGTVLLTGKIPRYVEFEKGFPPHESLVNGEWMSDPEVADDQAVVINIRDKGLVVLTGCGHSGIVNTLTYASSLQDNAPIHAVIGGFHLGGKLFETLIEPTIGELQRISPTTIVPGHCTGFQAIQAIAESMPGAFISSSVGSKYTF